MYHRIKTDRRDGKGRLCWYRDDLECCTSQQRWFEEKILEYHPCWEGGGLVLVNRMIIHFSKASIPPSIHPSLHPFLQTGTKWLVGHPVEFNQFHTPTRGDDLCLSYCLILNLWLLYTQLHKVWQIEAWFLSPLHYSLSRRNPSKDMSTCWPIRALHVPYLLVQVITEERVKKNMRVF